MTMYIYIYALSLSLSLFVFPSALSPQFFVRLIKVQARHGGPGFVWTPATGAGR